ncbi:peptide/nickel transport system permease protein [Prauserella shujinwangii]|uniref:Peptide/nickel transport system permease protein n=1 Tax=Prauserella shujinwangii TaxID=1453103 RepID=A0A2T0LY39_9PSEU|nr:ABC transporter permease [Prauserella shujinwangii]PRX49031.1 peptide/nickel transport system permease protein [Prauserella shujinwangii]
MLAYALRRLLISVPILIASTFIVFIGGALTANPLNQLQARNPPPPPRVLELERQRLNLDEPLLERYWNWLIGLFQGDFGPSVHSNLDLGSEVIARFGVTFRLIFLAMLIALILAIIVGVISAVKQYTKLDYTFTFFGFLFLAMPSFWFAILLKEAGISFNNAVGEQVLYTIGDSSVYVAGGAWAEFTDVLGHMVLPTISLALLSFAAWSRFQRASMLEVLNSDYVRLARAKGLRRGKVMRKHALRTALIPLTTVTALDLGAIISGAVVTENVYQWRGAGSFLLESIRNDDVYAIQAWLLISATFIILFNLVADLLYGVLDPRIRYA